MPVDEDCSLIMRETLLGARKAGLPDEVEEATPVIDVSEARRGGFVNRRLEMKLKGGIGASNSN